MLRVRFTANKSDPRPVKWPIKHPYWVTGETDDAAILVAYVDDLDELAELWPDASEVESEHRSQYTFTDRFPQPLWFKVPGRSLADVAASLPDGWYVGDQTSSGWDFRFPAGASRMDASVIVTCTGKDVIASHSTWVRAGLGFATEATLHRAVGEMLDALAGVTGG